MRGVTRLVSMVLSQMVISILLPSVILLLLISQSYCQLWVPSVSTFPNTETFASQTSNRFFARGNVMAALTTSSTDGLMFCNYFNGSSTVCKSAGLACNTGHFYAPDPDSTIYFYCTVLTWPSGTYPAQLAVFNVTATPDSVNPQLMFRMPTPETFHALDIDWSHRWLVLSGSTKLHLYDIKDPRNPVLCDSFRTTLKKLVDVHPRGISIRKNLVCSSNGFCVRFNPTTRQFLPALAGTLAATRSIRIFDDYIIQSSGSIQLYNTQTFNLLGSSPVSGSFVDFLRCGNIILTTHLGKNLAYVFNISNAYSISLLVNGSNTVGMVSLFQDEFSMYGSSWGGTGTISGTRVIQMDIPGSYAAFYQNSEWFDYAAPVNTLALISNNSTNLIFYYGESDTRPLQVHFEDTYTSENLTIFFNVTQPSEDFLVESFDGMQWTAIVRFTQFDVNAALIRIRYRARHFAHLAQNPQTLLLTVDNDRGSQLPLRIPVALVYGPGSRCPPTAVCTEYSANCPIAYEPDLSGSACKLCTTGFYKNTVDNSACRTCPSNSLCTTAGFECAAGYLLNPSTASCSPCPDGTSKSTAGNALTCTPSSPPVDNPNFLTIILTTPLYFGLAIGVLSLIVFLILIILLVYFYRRQRRLQYEKQRNMTDGLVSSVGSSRFTTTTTNTSMSSQTQDTRTTNPYFPDHRNFSNRTSHTNSRTTDRSTGSPLMIRSSSLSRDSRGRDPNNGRIQSAGRDRIHSERDRIHSANRNRADRSDALSPGSQSHDHHRRPRRD